MTDDLQPYDGYKISGLSWVNEIPRHWRMERAKWMFKLSALPVLPDHEIVTCFRDGQVTLRRNRRTRGFTTAVLEGGYQGILPGQLVVHAMDGFAGAIGVSDSEGKCTPEYSVLDAASESVDVHFYAYLLREMARLDFIRLSCPAVRQRAPRVRWANLREMTLPIPPLEEQAAIVRFLDHADRRIRRYIRAKRQLIALLNEQKQAIIHRAVTRGLNPHVKLKPSGVIWLGDVPEHWEVMRCRYIFREIDKRSRDGSEQHLSMSQKFGLVPSHLVDNRTLVSESYAGGKLCEVRDLVLNRLKAHLGVFSLARDAGVISPDYTVLRAFDSQGVEYYEQVLKSPACRFELRTRAKGIVEGFWRLYTDDFYDIKLPMPPLEERMKITAYIEDVVRDCDRTSSAAERQCELLREYRVCLVAKVVAGSLSVREAIAAFSEQFEAVESDAEELLEETEPTDDVEPDDYPEEVEA